MPVAYVLITTEVGVEEEVKQKLLQEPEVVTADVVFGVYDIVAKIKGETIEDIRKVVTQKIRNKIDKITSTQTLIVVTEE
ncbi:MAG TPA: Lrp/AsnC family transcriptional regulator [Thermoprotei archaeon]|nr:Lrp/AsnC family transcriptional regulator [Thermoprotei archaeon]